MYSAIVSATNHPDPYHPYMGLFNFRSIKAIGENGVDLNVVSPRPIAPPLGPYSEFRNIPAEYTYNSHVVHYPRFAYLIPQKIFRYTLSARSISQRLPRFLERNFNEPDIAHAGHIHYDGYALLPYCRKHGIPFTVMGRGKILNNYDSLSRIAQSKIDTVLDECSHIFCVSDSLAEIASEITDHSKVSTLANGANPDWYPTDRRDDIRNELEIDKYKTVVLFCGGFTKRKGIHEIIEALNDIKNKNVQLVFVGHYGNLRDQLLEALKNSHHDSYNVLWNVPPLALRRWYTAADILILPSHAEGRPNVVYEAMASKTAVIGTDVSGIPEQVNDDKTGILIPPKNVQALSHALNHLIENEDKRERMGDNGLKRLHQKGWTWTDHAHQMMEIHSSIIQRYQHDL
ncbi:glycosyltransferase family 4 protein [Halalkalicoccus salilacus]|uniref:glycosyltransferase family 4 protein n=1 Tax=Halalkalicoccus TaxID=332246 RepID=UPI002F968864